MLSFRNIIIPFLLSLLGIPKILFAQGLINQNATIIQKGGNIVTKQNLMNNGKLLLNNGTIVFSGTQQYINGQRPIAFKRLWVKSGSTTNINNNGNTIQSILLSDGNIYPNNKLTLLSNSNETALIDGNGIGEVIGNLTVQSYFANSYGYKFLGSPFQNATVNDYAPYVNLSASFPSVYQYAENQLTNGWVNFMNTSNALAPMKAYAFQLGDNTTPLTISLSGQVNNGTLQLNLNNNNQPYTKGFHLISNPYPSPINWDATTGWVKTNIDNAIYFFDTDGNNIYTGVYNSYINGISSNGLANNIIPAMQGFFVHVSDGNYPVLGNLQISNGARLNSIDKDYRRINDVNNVSFIRINASINNHLLKDNLVIYFNQNAQQQFDKSIDAIKLMNTSSKVPNIYTFKNSTQKLSIHASSLESDFVKIPIGIDISSTGMVHFENSIQGNEFKSRYTYLYDEMLKQYYNLQDSVGVQLSLSEGIINNRFYIILSKSPIVQSSYIYDDGTKDNFVIKINGQQIQLKLLIPNNEQAQIVISNIAGQIIFIKEYTYSGNYVINLPLSTGVYFISKKTSKSNSTKKIFIGQ